MASLLVLIRSLFQQRLNGVYPARVVSNQDPSGLGRVRVSLPDPSGGSRELGEAWAPIAILMAGNKRGTWFIPEPDDEVLLAFGGGDISRPYVLGALWSAGNPPPELRTPPGRTRLSRSIRTMASRSASTM